jgi:hypothetical protein
VSYSAYPVRCATRLAVCFVVLFCQSSDESQYVCIDAHEGRWWRHMNRQTFRTELSSFFSTSHLCIEQNCFFFVLVFLEKSIHCFVFLSSFCPVCAFSVRNCSLHTKNFSFSVQYVRARVCVCQAVRLKNKNLNLDKSI